jgi:hypothetical protein
MSQKLTDTSTRADLAASASLYTPPRFDPYDTSTSLISYFGPPSRLTDVYAQAFGSKLLSFTSHQYLSQRAATVYWGLRNLSQLNNVHNPNAFVDTTDITSIQYSDQIEMLERIAVPLWLPNSRSEAHPAIFKIFGLALLIYLYVELRDIPLSVKIMKTHAARIRMEMERAGEILVDGMCQAFPEMMLWVVFLAGKAAELQGKGFFAARVARILVLNGMGDMEGLGKRGIERAASEFLRLRWRQSGFDWEQVDRILA